MSADVLDFRSRGRRIRGDAWAEAYQEQHDRRFAAQQQAAYEAELAAQRQANAGLRPLTSLFDDWARSGFPELPAGERIYHGDRPPVWDTPGFGRRRRMRDDLFGGPDLGPPDEAG